MSLVPLLLAKVKLSTLVFRINCLWTIMNSFLHNQEPWPSILKHDYTSPCKSSLFPFFITQRNSIFSFSPQLHHRENTPFIDAIPYVSSTFTCPTLVLSHEFGTAGSGWKFFLTIRSNLLGTWRVCIKRGRRWMSSTEMRRLLLLLHWRVWKSWWSPEWLDFLRLFCLMHSLFV